MSTGFFKVPVPKNETVLSYAPGTRERQLLKQAIAEARSQVMDIPMFIGAEEVRTGNLKKLSPPHDHKHLLANYTKVIKVMSPRRSTRQWQPKNCGLT